MSEENVCTVCGKPLAIGQQGCIFRVIDHEPVGVYHPFIPYLDIALGVQVDSLAQRWRLMKPQYDGDEVSRGRLDYREKMSKGDLSARNDRIHQQLQTQERAARG